MELPQLSIFQKVCDLTKGALCRFPLAIMFCTWAGAALVYMGRNRDDKFEMVVPFLLLGAAAMILQVIGEIRAWPRMKSMCIQALGLALLFAVYWFLIHDMRQLLSLTAVLALGFLSLPLLRKDIDDDQIWTYYFHALMGLIFAALAAGLAGLAINSIAYGFSTILDLRVPRKFFEYIVIFCGAVFFPIAFMGVLPQSFEERRASPYLLSGLSFLLNYILVPLAFIQIVIMYGFLAKTFVTWELQKAGVAHITLMFFALGLVIFVATYPFRKTGTLLLRFFHAAFFALFLVPLLAAGVFLLMRVHYYGLTEPRYLAIGTVIAMLALTALHIRAPARRRLAEIPCALALVALTALAGPVGALDMSLHSQKRQLTALMQEHHLLDAQTGLVKTNVQSVTTKTYRRFENVVGYFIRRGDLSLIRDWVLPFDIMKLAKLRNYNHRARYFNDETLVCTKKFRNECSNRFGANWEGVVLDAWGIRVNNSHQRYETFARRQKIVTSSARLTVGKVLRVDSYIYLSSFDVATVTKPYGAFLNEAQERLDISAGIDATGHLVFFTQQGGGEERASKRDIRAFVEDILQRRAETDASAVKAAMLFTLTQDESAGMTYKIDRADFQAEVRLTRISFERDQEEGPIRITQIEGDLLFSLPE